MLTALPVVQVDPDHLDGVGTLPGDVLAGAGVRPQGEDPQHPLVVVDPARQAGRDQAGRGVARGGRRYDEQGRGQQRQPQDARGSRPGAGRAARSSAGPGHVEAEDLPALADRGEQQPAPQPHVSLGLRGASVSPGASAASVSSPGGGVTASVEVEPGRGAGRSSLRGEDVHGRLGAHHLDGRGAVPVVRRRDRGRRGRARHPWARASRVAPSVKPGNSSSRAVSGSRKAAVT